MIVVRRRKDSNGSIPLQFAKMGRRRMLYVDLVSSRSTVSGLVLVVGKKGEMWVPFFVPATSPTEMAQSSTQKEPDLTAVRALEASRETVLRKGPRATMGYKEDR